MEGVCVDGIEKEKTGVGMVWESDKYQNRYACSECGDQSTYTRIFENREIPDARFLCRNCSCDYVEKKGYRQLVLPFLKTTDVQFSPSPIDSTSFVSVQPEIEEINE